MSPAAENVVGLILAIVGAAMMAWGSIQLIIAARNYGGAQGIHRRREKVFHALGTTLLAIGLLIQLVAALSASR